MVEPPLPAEGREVWRWAGRALHTPRSAVAPPWEGSFSGAVLFICLCPCADLSEDQPALLLQGFSDLRLADQCLRWVWHELRQRFGSVKSTDKLQECWGSHPSTARSRAQLSAGPTGSHCVYMNGHMVTSPSSWAGGSYLICSPMTSSM